MNDFGNFLYELRKQKGMTQREIAERLHVTDKAVSKWETGEAFPSTEQLAPLSDLLEISVDELLRGREANEKTAEGESVPQNQIFRVGAAVSAICTALCSFVFLFLIGCRTDTGTVALYDYFYAVYKNLYDATGTLNFSTDSVPFATLFYHALIGTAFAAGIYIAVSALSVTAAVRAVKRLTGKRTKELTSPVTGCYFAYMLGAVLLLSHWNLCPSPNGAAQKTALCGATVAGLTLGALSLAAFCAFSFLQNREPFSVRSITEYAFSVLHVALSVAALCVLASPLAGTELADGTCKYSVGAMLRMYAHQYINTDSVPYEGVVFAAICYLTVLPVFALLTARLAAHTRNLCDSASRSTQGTDIALCVLGAAFAAFMLLPVRTLSTVLGGSPLYGGVYAVCALNCVMFVCSLAKTVTFRILQKRRN